MRIQNNQLVGEGIFESLLRNAKLLAQSEEMYEDRPSFDEELHGVFIDKGKYYNKKAMFLGPKTRLKERIKRGDDKVEMSPLDKAAMYHDKAYDKIGKKDISKEEKMKEIHDADSYFIKEITGDTVTPKTSMIAKKAMTLKMLAESTGLLSPDVFSLTGEGKVNNELLEIEKEMCYPCVIMAADNVKQKGGFVPLLVSGLLSVLAPIAIDMIVDILSKKKGAGKEMDVKDVTLLLSKQSPTNQTEILSKVVNTLGTDAFKT